MGDVEVGVVVEIKTGAVFAAERGQGIRLRTPDGHPAEATLSTAEDLSKMFWTLGFRGRPALPLVTVLEELIDASSVGGAVFDLGSATYDLTRLVTGQLDAYLDVGSRIIEEAPALEARFEEVGGGAVLNNSPYDLAAAVLCAEEAGAIVTDAHGAPLAARPLLGLGPRVPDVLRRGRQRAPAPNDSRGPRARLRAPPPEVRWNNLRAFGWDSSPFGA